MLFHDFISALVSVVLRMVKKGYERFLDQDSAEQLWRNRVEITIFVTIGFLRKTQSKFFFCTNRPEMVYSGANLSLKVKFEIKKLWDFY